MNTHIPEREKIKKQILDFVKQGVETVLDKYPELEFYAFAFSCNSEYAEIGLCFNTESEFQKTLAHYQKGIYSMYYQSEEEMRKLKYSVGDWRYLCFETLYVFTEEQLTEIYSRLPEDDYKSWNEFLNNLLDLFTECLFEFMESQTFGRIPKTKDFIAFCIDHDEDFEEALRRSKIKSGKLLVSIRFKGIDNSG